MDEYALIRLEYLAKESMKILKKKSKALAIR